MKSLYQPNTITEILDRISRLHNHSPNQWGKAGAAQMLVHCGAALEVATAQRFPPRIFIGYVMGGILKPFFTNEKSFKTNPFTHAGHVVANECSFNTEKSRLVTLIARFYAGGEQKCTTHPHWFFGKLTPQEWGIGMYKQVDHCLRQFGV